MSGSDLICTYWNKQQKNFLDKLNSLLLQLNGDAIHDLRVAVKKIRSYLELYNLLTGPDEDGLQLADTKTLFNIMGKYRDSEICINVLQNFNKVKKDDYSSLQIYLQSALQLSQRKINDSLKNFKPGELQSIGNIIHNRLSLESNDSIFKKTNEIIRQKLVATIESSKKEIEQPHELRKQLKILYYWLMLLPEGSILSIFKIKKLNKVLELLGSWQDQQVLLIRARHYRKDVVPKRTEEYRSIKKLETQLSEKSKKILASTGMQTYILMEAIKKSSKSKSMATLKT